MGPATRVDVGGTAASVASNRRRHKTVCVPKGAQKNRARTSVTSLKISQEGGRDLRKVYTLRVVCGVPFYHIVMPLPSNSGGSPIKIDSASEKFPIFSQTCTHWRKNIKFSLTIQNISDLNYPKRTDLRLRFPGNPRRDNPRTLRLGTGGLIRYPGTSIRTYALRTVQLTNSYLAVLGFKYGYRTGKLHMQRGQCIPTGQCQRGNRRARLFAESKTRQ